MSSLRRVAIITSSLVALCLIAELSRAKDVDDRNGGGALVDIGLIGVGVGLMMGADHLPEPSMPESLPLDRERVPFFDRVAIGAPRYNVQYVGFGSMVVAGLASWGDLAANRDDGWSHVGASAESVLMTMGVVGVLKEIAHRKRPTFYDESIREIDGLELEDSFRSWPSGDAALAFTLATSYVLSLEDDVGRERVVVAYSLATLISAARVVAHKHFPSDVLSGAAIGTGIAFGVHALKF